MPIIVAYMDSFDHYLTADLTSKWNLFWGRGGDASPTISLTAGRKGYGLLLQSDGNVYKSIPDTQTLTTGFAFRCTQLSENRILAYRDEGVVQLYLMLLSSGRLGVYRGDGVLLGLSTTVIAPSKFYYIEFNATIAHTNGVIQLRIGGTSELSLTFQNTQFSGVLRANIVGFGSFNALAHGEFHIDDIVITNGALLGPQKIDVIRPNGGVLGYTANMSAVGGAGSLYQAINDTTPDSDTSYIYSPSAQSGSGAFFEYENIANVTGGAVHAIAVHTYVRKEYGNTRGFQTGLFPGTHDGAAGNLQYYDDPLYIETEYAYHSSLYDSNPGTSGTWTVGSVNALKAGFKRYA